MPHGTLTKNLPRPIRCTVKTVTCYSVKQTPKMSVHISITLAYDCTPFYLLLLRGAISTPSSFRTVSSGWSHRLSYQTQINGFRTRRPARSAHGTYVLASTSLLPRLPPPPPPPSACPATAGPPSSNLPTPSVGRELSGSVRGRANGPKTAPKAHTGSPVCTSSNHFKASSPSTVGGRPLSTCHRS